MHPPLSFWASLGIEAASPLSLRAVTEAESWQRSDGLREQPQPKTGDKGLLDCFLDGSEYFPYVGSPPFFVAAGSFAGDSECPWVRRCFNKVARDFLALVEWSTEGYSFRHPIGHIDIDLQAIPMIAEIIRAVASAAGTEHRAFLIGDGVPSCDFSGSTDHLSR